MIPKLEFGRTGHSSTRVIFGAYALNKATPGEADRVLALLRGYGVNHIDTAPMYGNAEKVIGPWLAKHRSDFFVATKTRSRSRSGALSNLTRSLERLRVDYIDLWQMHGLTNPQGWEKAMGPKGALEAFVEARDQGLVRFLGVTGHGTNVPVMHKRSLERFDFDTVLLPYNYVVMQNSCYAAAFNELVGTCRERNVAVQTIKSLARGPWGSRPKTYNTYFYEPLETQAAIDTAVHWSLGFPNSFLITAGDLQLLPRMLDAANRFEKRPSDIEMRAMVDAFDIQPIFSRTTQRKGPRARGPQTWGGQMSKGLQGLVREGFFKHPNKRTLEHVVKALESKGLLTRGKESNISNSLAGRVKKGILKRSKTPSGWIYWTE
ncbi:MAG: aldo/keto reductase [Candidatus Bathyarchaeota archaeon]|nr:MAG: aldo/keto reductase [Candidatus Bathyarchaeota archaeon]